MGRSHRLVIIYLGATLLTLSCSLPGHQTKRAVPSLLCASKLAKHQIDLLGLASGGVCLASDIAATAGGLLHHRFTLTRRRYLNNTNGQYASLLHLPADYPPGR